MHTVICTGYFCAAAYGGAPFDEPALFAMFDALPDVQYTKAPLPKDAGLLKPGPEKDFDVIVRYDMVGIGTVIDPRLLEADITPEQQKAFAELLQRGIAVVSLHQNLSAHQDWPEFTRIIGGKWF